MEALRRYAYPKLFNLELTESILVCDNCVLILLQISISNMQFDFRYGSNYSVYKVVIHLLHFFLP